jgi:hypothetical protein
MAQSELDSLQREQEYNKQVKALEDAKDAKLKAIEDEIEGWNNYKDEWQAVVDDYTNEQDKLIAEQLLGANSEANILAQRLIAVQLFAQQYKAVMGSLSALGKSDSSSYVDVSTETGSGTGKAPAGLSAGTVVHTSGGDYVITGTKSGGGYTSQKLANGTTNASGGLSLVGEQGAEMRVLNSGDGIIPSRLTANLMSLGKFSPSQWFNMAKGGTESSMSLSISKVILPDVSDAPSFISGIKNLAHQYSAQRV